MSCRAGHRQWLAAKWLTCVDMDHYSELAGHQFPDPLELEEELQQLRDDHEAEGDLQREQAVTMERERQELANQAMHDAEGGGGVGAGGVHEQPSKRKKKAKGKEQKTGEVVLSMTIEEYERERLRQLEEDG